MRHRKKLIVAAFLLLAGGYASLCFWPHSNPEAVRALAALREMVQVDEAIEAPPAMGGEPQDDVLICIEINLVAVNMTDATTGLFAEPHRVSDTRTVGRIKAGLPFAEMLRSTWLTTLSGRQYQIVTVAGQNVRCTNGGQVAVLVPQPAGNSGVPTVTYRNIGTTLGVTPRVTAAGGFILDFECELAQAGKAHTIATAQGPMEISEVHAISAKTRAELKPGETLVVGGLSRKRPEKSMFKLPVLGELPGVGSWFQFTREREIEEEVVLLVTSRIIQVAPQTMLRAASPAPKQIVLPVTPQIVPPAAPPAPKSFVRPAAPK